MWVAMEVALFTAVAFGSFQNVHSLLSVDRTVVHNASPSGAVCLDGSPPAHHLGKGFGSGAQNWLLQIEGGAWCEDLVSCYLRSKTAYGSSQLMGIWNFHGILSNDPSMNPARQYCDGATFADDSEFNNGTLQLYFRGQKIFAAIINNVLPKRISAGAIGTAFRLFGWRALYISPL